MNSKSLQLPVYMAQWSKTNLYSSLVLDTS